MTKERKESLARHEKARGKVMAFVEKWKADLWLGHWSIDTVLEWNGIHSATSAHGHVLGECDADWRYLSAKLRFNLPELSVLSDEKIEEVVVHELLHVHLNEMREQGLPHEERVCSLLTQVMLFLSRRKR